MGLWGIGELDSISGKCGSLRLGTPSNLKVNELLRLYKKLHFGHHSNNASDYILW